MHRPSRRTSAVIAAAVCLLGGGVVSGAQALQPARHPVAAGAAERPSKLHLPKPPGPNSPPLGLTVDRSVQSVKRAKISFNVKPFRALVYLVAVPTGTGFEDGTAYIYVTDPTGPADQFGDFAPVTVHTLAFGTLPVSATVHISQIQHGKFPEPFVAKVHFSTTFVMPPTPLPCSPPTQPRNLCQYTDAAHLSGEVDVRVDNVRVDQVPVDVGPNCHTATPATLSLASKAGYYGFTTPPYTQPGIYFPFLGGTLSGPVNVPAFTGCTSGGDDLSPVVTAMVAGPDNQLSAHQLGGFVEYPPPRPPTK